MWSLTLRPLLFGLLTALSLVFAFTLTWTIGLHHEFVSNARSKGQAETALAAIHQQLRLKHEPRALELAQVGASLPVWPRSVADMGPTAVEQALNEAIGQELFTTGEIRLRGAALLDHRLQLIASKTVEGHPDVIWSTWREELAERKGLDARRVASRYLQDSEGGTVHLIVHPIGGLRLAGYLAIVTDPAKALSGMTAFLHGRVIVESMAGDVILDEKPAGWPAETGTDSVAYDAFSTASFAMHSPEGLPLYQVQVQNDDTSFVEEAARLRTMSYLVAGVATIAALIAATILLRITVFRRVKAVSTALQRIVAGDTDVNVPMGGADEIGAMVEDLHRVADHVRKVISLKVELTAHRDHLEEMVKDRTAFIERQAADVEKALEKEKQLSAIQRGFVSMASHEFRTPLAIIEASAQSLERRIEKMSTDGVRDKIKKIRTAVKRMVRLMESTLDAAKMEAGKVEIVPVNVDIREILRECCNSQMEFVTSHQITLDADSLPENVVADPGALTQIFSNLLSNAIKYSPNANCVDVRGWSNENDVFVSVVDYGLGMDAEDQQELFNRFFRAKTSTGIAGTGIGLNLVKMLVEEHGGSISVRSEEAVGSDFTVKLPRRGPVAAEMKAA